MRLKSLTRFRGGASWARAVVALRYNTKRLDAHLSLVTVCITGDERIAMVIEG